MRHLIISLLALIIVSGLKANDSQLFTYDKAKVENSLNNLTEIEKIVNEHPGIETQDLLKKGIIEENSLSQFNSPISLNGEPPLGIPSFLWGCIFGVAGMIVVLIMTDKDKPEITKALYGCLTAYVSLGIFYFFILSSSGAL